MPRLSCIIPVVAHAHGLETTLVSVLEHFPDDCEIIVVHSAPYDDPYDLKSELRFIEAPRRTGFVGCANLGIEASHSPIVHLLAAGLDATNGWAEAALARFADPSVAAVAPVVCNQFDSEEVLAAGAMYHSGGRVEISTDWPAELEAAHDPAPRPRPLSPKGRGENSAASAFPIARAAFFRRSALNLFGGGFPTSVGDELAAAELALSLTHAGYRTVVEPNCKILGAANYFRAWHGFRFGMASERLFWRNLPTTGYLASLGMHPFSIARDLIGSLANGAAILQLLGRIAAYATLSDCPARHAQLRAAEELAALRAERSSGIHMPAHVRDRCGAPRDARRARQRCSGKARVRRRREWCVDTSPTRERG